jgi:hypothetical protein
MNKYNQSFLARIAQASKALNELNGLGCAITNLVIGDNGSVIEILPPRTPKLTGQVTRISGDENGKHMHMQTRMHGCNVRWQHSPNQFNQQ